MGAFDNKDYNMNQLQYIQGLSNLISSWGAPTQLESMKMESDFQSEMMDKKMAHEVNLQNIRDDNMMKRELFFDVYENVLAKKDQLETFKSEIESQLGDVSTYAPGMDVSVDFQDLYTSILNRGDQDINTSLETLKGIQNQIDAGISAYHQTKGDIANISAQYAQPTFGYAQSGDEQLTDASAYAMDGLEQLSNILLTEGDSTTINVDKVAHLPELHNYLTQTIEGQDLVKNLKHYANDKSTVWKANRAIEIVERQGASHKNAELELSEQLVLLENKSKLENQMLKNQKLTRELTTMNLTQVQEIVNDSIKNVLNPIKMEYYDSIMAALVAPVDAVSNAPVSYLSAITYDAANPGGIARKSWDASMKSKMMVGVDGNVVDVNDKMAHITNALLAFYDSEGADYDVLKSIPSMVAKTINDYNGVVELYNDVSAAAAGATDDNQFTYKGVTFTQGSDSTVNIDGTMYSQDLTGLQELLKNEEYVFRNEVRMYQNIGLGTATKLDMANQIFNADELEYELHQTVAGYRVRNGITGIAFDDAQRKEAIESVNTLVSEFEGDTEEFEQRILNIAARGMGSTNVNLNPNNNNANNTNNPIRINPNNPNANKINATSTIDYGLPENVIKGRQFTRRKTRDKRSSGGMGTRYYNIKNINASGTIGNYPMNANGNYNFIGSSGSKDEDWELYDNGVLDLDGPRAIKITANLPSGSGYNAERQTAHELSIILGSYKLWAERWDAERLSIGSELTGTKVGSGTGEVTGYANIPGERNPGYRQEGGLFSSQIWVERKSDGQFYLSEDDNSLLAGGNSGPYLIQHDGTEGGYYIEPYWLERKRIYLDDPMLMHMELDMNRGRRHTFISEFDHGTRVITPLINPGTTSHKIRSDKSVSADILNQYGITFDYDSSLFDD